MGRKYLRCWIYKRNVQWERALERVRAQNSIIKRLGVEDQKDRQNISWLFPIFKPKLNQMIIDLQESVEKASFFVWLKREDETWSKKWVWRQIWCNTMTSVNFKGFNVQKPGGKRPGSTKLESYGIREEITCRGCSWCLYEVLDPERRCCLRRNNIAHFSSFYKEKSW